MLSADERSERNTKGIATQLATDLPCPDEPIP